jgi:hypothetical protein
MNRRLLILGLATFWLIACARVPDVDSDVAANVSNEALEVLSSAEIGELDKSLWPDGIARLNPESVLVRPEGLYIVTGRRFVEEWGYFVARDVQAFTLPQGGDPSYKRITEYLFKYKVTG